MTIDILHETVIGFIRGEPKHAALAQLVAEAVPVLKARIREEVIHRIRTTLDQFSNQSSAWTLKVHEKSRSKRVERIHLCRNREHWLPHHNHGVWFVWADHDDQGWLTPAGGWVGVEWPLTAESFLVRRDLVQLFPDAPATKEEGRRGEDKEWFARPPRGSEWIGWTHLLVKSDAELQEYARAVADFMKRLAEEIDTAEATRQDEANRVGN